ncbi:hypothetical protein SAMN06265375_102238 [Muriicola jejuensis]|uniref:Outer membrane beta-barrel protein n=1 Tax=Muriicola jejuensis TaxID=504488 RepID=A0A6P0UBW9_9FLAO|nr:hypothetical protein [Muriicola jejuensis]NER10781.1 hypothetical protein [Muriicola jejuensis]SMP16260.1 hypothetical protein SAMN06265375_102238 [Muriicola jejuensis]
MRTLLKRSLITLFVFLAIHSLQAQGIKERSLDILVGLGLSAPYDDVDVVGTGFYIQGEYVLTFNKWVSLRPYAGLILVKTSDADFRENFGRSDTQAFLIGGKGRVTIPIPWVAPYLELGLGASLGSFRTLTPFTDAENSGLIHHIPFSIGLALGRQNKVDIAFTYYFHPTERQFAGAAAFGLSIPLD